MPKLDFYSTFHYHALVSPINFTAGDDEDTQKSSEAINMISLIASDLHTRGLRDFYLSAGRVTYYDQGVSHEPWTLFAYFGDSQKGMDLQTRLDAREAVLSVIRVPQPSHEKAIQDLLYMPNALHDRFNAKRVVGETRFQISGGRAFVHKRDGMYDEGGMERCEYAQVKSDLKAWERLSRALSKLLAGGGKEKKAKASGGFNAPKTKGLTFEEALAKLQTPWELSKEEKAEVDELETIIEVLQATEREVREQKELEELLEQLKVTIEKLETQEAEKQYRDLAREEAFYRTRMRSLAIKSLALSGELASEQGTEEHKEAIRKKYMDCTNKMMEEVERIKERREREYAQEVEAGSST
ncbi:uncharacterized protein BDV14DRAFT_195368 [Aspergillus stella-maris]|uniref:uncharacterized protein n=1 Tax=Aspergillus stella-maris TaxID=1810926 RepID=UPI003CCD6B3A